MTKHEYFIEPDTGRVVRANAGESAFAPASRLGGNGWTEVKVVPLDAIVIDRADLPEVTLEPEGYLSSANNSFSEKLGRDCNGTRAEWHEKKGLGHLAIAARLREHPPVDEKQVDTVQDFILEAIREGLWDDMTAREQAQYLIESGARVEVSKP